MSLKTLQEKLKALSNVQIAKTSQRFFKTGPGEYGEGDQFSGIRVPVLRKLAGEYQDLKLSQVTPLLQSPIHEQRQLALFILVRKYNRGNPADQKRIYELYLDNIQFVNNWDLVDCSAEHIVGAYLFDKSKVPLYQLARSENLWQRRIAIMSTFHFIKRNTFAETLKIAQYLLQDPEDLIHKAVGWMLREIGKRDLITEEQFLRKHYPKMPRTMLRYAIEKFPEPERQRYLKGKL
jgi:3-methyladenine DNA glycosylase AlkD